MHACCWPASLEWLWSGFWGYEWCFQLLWILKTDYATKVNLKTLVVWINIYTKDYLLHWGHVGMIVLDMGFHGHCLYLWGMNIQHQYHCHRHLHHIKQIRFWLLCCSELLLLNYACFFVLFIKVFERQKQEVNEWEAFIYFLHRSQVLVDACNVWS